MIRSAVDFTSSLYLGLRHGRRDLPGWAALTTGAPAALTPPPGAEPVAHGLAALVGCGAATVGVSTLHLLFDWFGTRAATEGTAVLWDAGIYAVSRWCVERAAARGVAARSFAHFVPAALARWLPLIARRGLRPIVVTDGYCPGCGRAAPLLEYLELARDAGGLVVVDDTQALGIFGDPCEVAPAGGGGSLRRLGLGDSAVLWVASLAKAFGVPLAALAGERALVARFEEDSETRVHSSPPNAACLAAAARALALNERVGQALRARLFGRVGRFRARVANAGLTLSGGTHPVQLLDGIAGVSPLALCRELARSGVRAVPLRPSCGEARLAFIITAAHDDDELDRAAALLERAVNRLRPRTPAAPTPPGRRIAAENLCDSGGRS
jgi:8-amino-7-oxononanoate synthase